MLALPRASWYGHVAIDPCASLLPKSATRLEGQQVAARGDSRYMSKGARREGINLRAPDTAKKQGGSNVLKVHWTPVLCRGKVRIYVCDPAAALLDDRLPAKLNDSAGLAKFVENVLPGILKEMAQQHGWRTLPRAVVHDKASYMVSPHHDRLNVAFARALGKAGLQSWVGTACSSAAWLAARFADVYPHETAISHIRRLLDTEYTCLQAHETEQQLRARMEKVEGHMNSADFAAKGGTGLLGLCKSLRSPCEEVLRREGGRLPK